MSILNAIKEAALKRADQWMTIETMKLPEPEVLKEMAMLGTFSYSLQQSRKRLVLKPSLIQIDAEVKETPPAVARDYLRHIYKRGGRATKKQLEKVLGIQPAPSYAKPSSFAYGYYVDIQSAYWSIMEIVGWNVDYNPERWLSPGRPPKDFPFADHKVARNCLVSAGRMGTIDPETKKPKGIPCYDPRRPAGEEYYDMVRGNALANHQLIRLIHDVLNTIAEQAISAGALYVNNDGYIAPDAKTMERISGIINDWGLTPRIKAKGGGEIKASGSYHVGVQKTLNYERTVGETSIHNVYAPSYKKWLQKEFSFFAAEGNEL